MSDQEIKLYGCLTGGIEHQIYMTEEEHREHPVCLAVHYESGAAVTCGEPLGVVQESKENE